MTGYIVSRPAQRDLEEIDAYISADNPPAADRLLDTFRRTFELLATTPAAGRLRPELGPSIRSLPVRSYVIFYRQTEAGVELVRVLHGRRDIRPAFQE